MRCVETHQKGVDALTLFNCCRKQAILFVMLLNTGSAVRLNKGLLFRLRLKQKRAAMCYPF